LALWVLYGLLLYWQWLLQKRPPRRPKAKEQPVALPLDLLQQPTLRLRVTLLLLFGIGLILASGWNGGKLVYTWGVNVLQ
jgi:hypothetical protein